MAKKTVKENEEQPQTIEEVIEQEQAVKKEVATKESVKLEKYIKKNGLLTLEATDANVKKYQTENKLVGINPEKGVIYVKA